MQWQPIETAPKNGTEILIFADGEQVVGLYDESYSYEDSHNWQRPNCGGIIYPATHWMPLPEPPSN